MINTRALENGLSKLFPPTFFDRSPQMNLVPCNVVSRFVPKHMLFAALLGFAGIANAQVPPIPTGLTPPDGAQIASTTQVLLSWASIPGATSYNVRANNWTNAELRDPQNNCPGSPHYMCVNGLTTTSLSMPVDPGSGYGFFMHACNAAGCSDVAFANFTVALPPPEIQICSVGGVPVLASNIGTEGASDAIQTCLDNGDLAPGNLWEIPRGVYMLDKQIGIRRSISIRTQGSLGTPACSRDETDGSNCAILKASPALDTTTNASRLTMIYVGNGLFNGQPVFGLPVSNVSLDYIIIDGNRAAREASASYCNGTTDAYRGGNIHFEISNNSSVTNSVTRNAVCGSGMHFIGDGATFTNNQFYANGADANSGVSLRWADGLTLLTCNSCTLTGNAFIDNTDVGLVFGGGTNTSITGSVFEQPTKRAFAAFSFANFNSSTSGDFTQSLFEQNTISCGTGNDRRCLYGINAGEHAWFPLAANTIGGTIRFNTVTNAIIGVHANATGTAAAPTSIYGNTVSGSPQCGTFQSLTCRGVPVSKRVCNWVYWQSNSFLTLGPTPTSPPENGALSEDLTGCNNF
jgi:hypothetical protein